MLCLTRCVLVTTLAVINEIMGEEGLARGGGGKGGGVKTVFSLKLDSYLSKKWFYFNEIPLKLLKNAFCLILKAPFILKIFKFMS